MTRKRPPGMRTRARMKIYIVISRSIIYTYIISLILRRVRSASSFTTVFTRVYSYRRYIVALFIGFLRSHVGTF